MMSIKLIAAANLLLLIILTSSCMFALSSPSSNKLDETVKPNQQTPPVREEPILYDFEHYRQSFHKKYGSRLEVAARKFYYYATLFKVYVSGVAFKFRQASSYLAVNKFSDWSRRELAMMDNKVWKDEHELGSTLSKQETDDTSEQNNLDTLIERLDPEQLEEAADELEDEAKKTLGDVSEVDSLQGNKRNKRQKRDVGSTLPKLRDQVKEVSFIRRRRAEIFNYKPRYDKSIKQMFSDLRKSGCMFPPSDQLSCGSCYAFAATAMAEFYYCKSARNLVKMSEQYMLDCANAYVPGANGCNGGSTKSVAIFIENFGLELAKHVPYAARDKQCQYRDPFDIQKTGYYRMELGSYYLAYSERWAGVLMDSPIMVGLKTPADFQQYGGGVYDGSGCRDGEIHAMVVVGSGQDYGQDFWLLRNSYGTDWGEEKGYFKLAKSATAKCINGDGGIVFGTRDGANFNIKTKLNEHYKAPSKSVNLNLNWLNFVKKI